MKILASLSAILLAAVAILHAETLTWTASPSGDLVLGYRVYWSTNRAAPLPWAVISTVSSNVLTAPGSTNTQSRNYYYATAFNASAESAPTPVAFIPSAPVAFTIIAP